MSLGAWVFATAVLLLVVLNAPFRKFFLRAAAVVAIIAAVAGGAWWAWDTHRQHVEAKQQAKLAEEHQKLVDACVDRFKQAKQFFGVLTQVSCEDNPGAQPDPSSVTLDFSKSIPLRPPKPKQPKLERHVTWLRVTQPTDLTTTEFGSLKCGELKPGEGVVLLVDDNANVRVKTADGVIGWASAGFFEVIQEGQ